LMKSMKSFHQSMKESDLSFRNVKGFTAVKVF